MRPERGFKMKARARRLLADSLVAEIADLPGPDRRPPPMRWFDRAFLAMMGLNLATLVTAIPMFRAEASGDPAAAQAPEALATLLGSIGIVFAVFMGIWFCVSRLRSRACRSGLIVFIGLYLMSTLSKLPEALTKDAIFMFLTTANAGMAAVAAGCLLHPAVRMWFRQARR